MNTKLMGLSFGALVFSLLFGAVMKLTRTEDTDRESGPTPSIRMVIVLEAGNEREPAPEQLTIVSGTSIAAAQ